MTSMPSMVTSTATTSSMCVVPRPPLDMAVTGASILTGWFRVSVLGRTCRYPLFSSCCVAWTRGDSIGASFVAQPGRLEPGVGTDVRLEVGDAFAYDLS